MSSFPLTDLVERFYRDIWNRHDKAAIAELLTENFSFRGSLGQETTGHEGMAKYVDSVHEALGNGNTCGTK